MKSPWQTPKLIVLVRGKPEECVLDTCKTGVGWAELDPTSDYKTCVLRTSPTSCESCEGEALS